MDPRRTLQACSSELQFNGVGGMAGPIRVTVWNEFRHETSNADIARIYPNGMHAAIACHLETRGFAVKTATLDEPQHGLTEDVLSETDVLTWWGHAAHREVEDEIVERVQRRVLDGMGLIVLHSGHFSKIFKKLMGTTCNLKWREIAEHERIWVVEPGHPIAQGLPPYFELDHVEMYGERFDIPAPDQLVLLSWFPAAMSSARAAASTAARARSSTSALGTRPSRSSTMNTY